ncbi:GNAT family N-acetyltransferase [Photobacterium sp. GJ3]|nr:GNAT family N-acetyltransferase [Photobacterium sp. GJ3]QUJ69080.1 GNAT family N-acetyltransferase [Photobacterium sp. GJ3]
MEMIQLNTDRLVLRPLTFSDAEPLFDIFSDPEVMQYWDGSPWHTLSQAYEDIQSSKASLDEPEKLVLGICDRESQTFIGKCMLFNIHPTSRRAEIGFGIAKAYWGKGVVFEAASALIRFAFEEMNLNRLEAEIDPMNRGSAKVLQKLGFVEEGYLPERWIVDGYLSDSALYGLLAKQWQKHQQSSSIVLALSER